MGVDMATCPLKTTVLSWCRADVSKHGVRKCDHSKGLWACHSAIWDKAWLALQTFCPETPMGQGTHREMEPRRLSRRKPLKCEMVYTKSPKYGNTFGGIKFYWT